MEVEPVKPVNLTGAYIIIVFNTCDKSYKALFHISKSDPSKCGHVVRLFATDNINLNWPPYTHPTFDKNVDYIIF